MGLADVLNSVQNDPSAQRAFGSGGGGMSPLTMALLDCSPIRPSKVSAAASQALSRPDRLPQLVVISARLAPDPIRQAALVIC